jgi:hypothetical protein
MPPENAARLDLRQIQEQREAFEARIAQRDDLGHSACPLSNAML